MSFKISHRLVRAFNVEIHTVDDKDVEEMLRHTIKMLQEPSELNILNIHS